MATTRRPFAQSQSLRTALLLVGDGSPAGVVHAPRDNVFYWDETNSDLYISEAIGKANWVFVAGSSTASPSSSERIDHLSTTADDQTVFTLSNTPSDVTKTKLWINGQLMTYSTHFTVSGTTLTFNPGAAGFDLELSNEFGDPDRLTVSYFI